MDPTIHRPALAALDHDFMQEVAWDAYDTVAPPHDDTAGQQTSRNHAVLTVLESLQPRNPLEAMLGAHIVASHHATIGCYRWAMATDPIGPPAARLRQNAAALTRTLHGNIRMLQRCQAEPAGVAPAGAGVAPVGAGVPPAGAGIVAPEAPQQQQHPVPGEQDAGRAGPGEPAAREWPRAYDRSDAPSCGEGPLSPGGLISSAEVLEFDRTIARPAAAPAAPLEPAAPSEPAAPVAAAASGHAPAGGDAGDAAAPGGPGVVCTLALGRRDRRPQAAAPALTQHDLAALAARDPAGPTDDELGILGHTQAPPGQTCDDSWRHPVRGPRAPRPETMTLEQRRAFYGYVVPPEFAAAGAVPPPPPACGPDGGGHEPGQ